MALMNARSGPITGRSRWLCSRSGGSAFASAWRTIRRCTPSLCATPLIVPTPNSYSLRICSNSSTFAFLSIPSLPPHRQDAPASEVGPIYGVERGRFTVSKPHAWQIGPAAAAIYRGIPHLMAGFLWQEPMSFAYTNSSATPQSQFEFQPLISYTLGRGWYVKSADSTWTINWRHNTSTTIPISLGFGNVWKSEGGPELNPWFSFEWTAYHQYAGITPKYTLRFGLTLLFPHLEL